MSIIFIERQFDSLSFDIVFMRRLRVLLLLYRAIAHSGKRLEGVFCWQKVLILLALIVRVDENEHELRYACQTHIFLPETPSYSDYRMITIMFEILQEEFRNDRRARAVLSVHAECQNIF